MHSIYIKHRFYNTNYGINYNSRRIYGYKFSGMYDYNIMTIEILFQLHLLEQRKTYIANIALDDLILIA